MLSPKIKTSAFYNNYYGHTINHLQTTFQALKDYNDKEPEHSCFIYLAGDSSLDNKHWILNQPYGAACNGYQTFLDPPMMVKDMCYNLSNAISTRGIKNTFVINCAVEESTLGVRKYGNLLPHDKFIRENIRENDILVVSVGGNDIALSPSISTIWNMIKLVSMNSIETLTNNPEKAWGMPHFIDLFKNQTSQYIKNLVSKHKPSKVVICTIYYPDERTTGSWADTVLGYLGYNSNPMKLQTIIRHIYNAATTQIQIPGVQVIPFPMFEVLDGSVSSDYVQRVEPSVTGGKKLAHAMIDRIMD